MNHSTTNPPGVSSPRDPDGRPRDDRLLPWEAWRTVTQINEQIRDLLEDALPVVRVRGEISD